MTIKGPPDFFFGGIAFRLTESVVGLTGPFVGGAARVTAVIHRLLPAL